MTSTPQSTSPRFRRFMWIGLVVGALVVTGIVLLSESDGDPAPAVVRCIGIGYDSNSISTKYGARVVVSNLTDEPLTIGHLEMMALSNNVASQWQNAWFPGFGMKPHEMVSLTIPVTNNLMPTGRWWIDGEARRPLGGISSVIARFRYVFSTRRLRIPTGTGTKSIFDGNVAWSDDKNISSAWFYSTNVSDTQQSY